MSEVVPPYSYKPSNSEAQAVKRLYVVSGRSSRSEPALFRGIADVIAVKRGFDPNGQNELATRHARGSLTLNYGQSLMDGGVVFAQAWGSDYIFDFIEKEGEIRGYSHDQEGNRYPINRPQRELLAHDLRFVLIHSSS